MSDGLSPLNASTVDPQHEEGHALPVPSGYALFEGQDSQQVHTMGLKFISNLCISLENCHAYVDGRRKAPSHDWPENTVMCLL